MDDGKVKLERSVEKKLQIIEFEVKAFLSACLLDFEDKMNHRLLEMEKNNRNFRRVLTHELVDKTRYLFAAGLADTENRLTLKLEENAGRIEGFHTHFSSFLREKVVIFSSYTKDFWF